MRLKKKNLHLTEKWYLHIYYGTEVVLLQKLQTICSKINAVIIVGIPLGPVDPFRSDPIIPDRFFPNFAHPRRPSPCVFTATVNQPFASTSLIIAVTMRWATSVPR
jgi:hypothetical protein